MSVTVRAGGSYVVARDNFGPKVAQIAAVAAEDELALVEQAAEVLNYRAKPGVIATTGTMARRCSRLASSGTTPP